MSALFVKLFFLSFIINVYIIIKFRNVNIVPITYGRIRLITAKIIDALYCLSYKSIAPKRKPIITVISPILEARVKVKATDSMSTQT